MMNPSDDSLQWNDKARQFRKLIELDPTDELPPYMLAELFVQEGYIKESLFYFDKAVCILEAKGSQEKALIIRSKMYDLVPGDRDLKKQIDRIIGDWQCEVNGLITCARVNRLLQLCDLLIRNLSKHVCMIVKLEALADQLQTKRNWKEII